MDAEPSALPATFAERARVGESVRLGIMGGTFDPVHLGHLACAEMARDALGLDGVVFMVASCPWMKEGRRIADGSDRAEMCRIAVRGNDAFSVDVRELLRPGDTYTLDTLRELREELPESVELVFIIGSDSLLTLPGWKDAKQLAELATFACVSRPGSEKDPEALARAKALGFNLEFVDAPLLDVSSSEIRRRVKAGETIRYLVPDGVREYIEEAGLYEGAGHGRRSER